MPKTKHSPCSNGDIVPASTFKYGSIFIAVIGIFNIFKTTPTEEAVTPLPTSEKNYNESKTNSIYKS